MRNKQSPNIIFTFVVVSKTHIVHLSVKGKNTKLNSYLVEGIFAVFHCCIQIRYVAGKTTLEKVNIGCFPALYTTIFRP